MDDGKIQSLLPKYLLHSEIYYVVITDLEGRYIFVNEVFRKRFAFLTEDFIGKPFDIAVHPEDVEKCNLASYQCITNPNRTFQVQVRKPDTPEGDYYWTSWEFSLFKDQNQNPIGIFCLGYDITETKRASRKAKEFAQKVDTIIEEITDGFCVLNRQWEFVKVNHVTEEILNKTKQELLGKKIWDLFPDTPEYNYPAQFRKAMNEYVTVAFEDYHADLDKWFSVVSYPSKEGLSVFFRDITQEKKMQQQLKDSEYKLRAILDNTTDGNILVSSDYKIINFNKTAAKESKEIFGKSFYEGGDIWEFVKVNHVAEEILNKTKQELLGKKIWDLFPDTPEYNYPAQFRKAMNEYVIVAFEDYRADLDRWFSAVGYPSQEGLSVFFRDITQEKKMQQQLKDSEYKLRAILDSTTDGNILVSSDYKIINFNKTAAKESKEIFGKSFYKGGDIWEFVLPEDKEAFWQDSQMALQGNILDFEKKINGIWFQVRYFPVYDDTGKIFGFTLNASNIDARKKAEEKLRQSEIMLRALYDSSNEALTLIDTNYKILYNNRLAKEITKSIFGRETQIGDDSLDYYVPEVREEFANYYQRVLQGETITVEKEYQSVWWRFNLYPVYDNENKIFAIAINLKNITRRKQQDLALQETQQRLDKTIEAIPHPLLIVDAETMQITYVNAEFEKVFGYTEQEVLGETTDFLLPERLRAKHRFFQKEYLKKGGLIRNMGRYLPALIKDGRKIYIDASLNTFVASGKKHIIVILEDVSEQKKQQDQILLQNETLQQIAWQQSHEVRRPVANILGLCELLQNYKDEPEEVKEKYIAYMVKATQELDEIIHKIVELSNHLS